MATDTYFSCPMPRQNRSPKSTHKNAQQVRIIGGKWKGRKVHFPSVPGLRPTPVRIRQTLFNWLRPHMHDTDCLDLFAGSGVLGFEALSQGAASLTSVDMQRDCRQSIHAEVEQLSGSMAIDFDVQAGDALRYLRACATCFDIIFVDPPYDQPDLLANSLSIIAERSLCRGFIYAESRSIDRLHDSAEHAGLVVFRETQAGDAHGLLLTVPPD